MTLFCNAYIAVFRKTQFFTGLDKRLMTD